MWRYDSEIHGVWRLWLRRDLWSAELWQAVQERLMAERPVKHPRTVEICLADGQRFFIKIFFPVSFAAALKDSFRRSRAVRALFAGARLGETGFHAPVAAGAGEERFGARLRRSFLVTVPVPGMAVPEFLRQSMDGGIALPLRRKRELLCRFARELRRFHDRGFVHGDLVAGNVFLDLDGEAGGRFFFMDNDRTRRYLPPTARPLCRRNLVQLNRLPLPGISLQDRMRFFHGYVNLSRLGRRERRLLAWLERRTRRRRYECDGVDVSGSFRRLMCWHQTTNA